MFYPNGLECVMSILNQFVSESVESKMQKSDVAFYLTGSKFFGGTHASSDTDYFVRGR